MDIEIEGNNMGLVSECGDISETTACRSIAMSESCNRPEKRERDECGWLLIIKRDT